MTLATKILLALLVLTVISALGFVAYKSNQISKQQDDINKSLVEFKQMKDDIARSSSQYATKDDLDNFAKQNKLNLDEITKNLSALNASITGINQITVDSTGTNQTGIASTTTTPNPTPIPQPSVDCNGKQISCSNADQFGYLTNQQHLTLNEQFVDAQVPVGDVAFSAWQKNPWDVDVYPRKYSITNVLGTDEDGKHYVYNKFSINAAGKDYPVKIDDAKFVEEYPQPSFSFWNPRIFAGVDGGIGISKLPIKGEITPGVHIGIMSYGNNKTTVDWSFIQVGVGYGTVSRNLQIEISPAQYNIGQHLPLMKNIYLGPALGVGTDGNVMIGAGLRVGL